MPPPTPGLEPTAADYAVDRAAFRTNLLRKGPAPGPSTLPETPPGALATSYRSAPLLLRAYLAPDPGDSQRHPAVLFLHGGYAPGAGHWDMAAPFRAAGYVVMVPSLRGECGQAGDFSLFSGEIDDVLAAADALALVPYVDPDRIYIAGHSVGGTLSMLAAMASRRFRAAASISGSPDVKNYVRGRSELVPFDPADDREYRLRSAVAYASSFKCPARLFYGDEEYGLIAANERTAGLARRAGLDVRAVEVSGDHSTCVPAAMAAIIAFFDKIR